MWIWYFTKKINFSNTYFSEFPQDLLNRISYDEDSDLTRDIVSKFQIVLSLYIDLKVGAYLFLFENILWIWFCDHEFFSKGDKKKGKGSTVKMDIFGGKTGWGYDEFDDFMWK